MLTHLAKSVKGRFRQRPGPFYSVFKERCGSLLDSPAALIRYLIGHRLAFVHGNAEVCLPSNRSRKQGNVAAERATGGKTFYRSRLTGRLLPGRLRKARLDAGVFPAVRRARRSLRKISAQRRAVCAPAQYCGYGPQAGFPVFTFGIMEKFSGFPGKQALFLHKFRSKEAPLWSFRRIF